MAGQLDVWDLSGGHGRIVSRKARGEKDAGPMGTPEDWWRQLSEILRPGPKA